LPVGEASAAARSIPPAAAAVIRDVHAAAAASDYAALERAMTSEFVWSFGGDGEAAQALDQWRKKPRYLRELHRVTSASCDYRDGLVECPARAGAGYRAGFRLTAAGWKMVYFVAGD